MQVLSILSLCLCNLSGCRACQVPGCLGDVFLSCSLQEVPPAPAPGYCPQTGQFNNRAVLFRQDEEVPDLEEQDEISENEAEEEEEFCAGKSLWDTEESLNSQLHTEIAVKVQSRAF